MKMLAIIGLSLATAFSGVVPAAAFPTGDRPMARTTDVRQVESWQSSWGIGRYGGGSRYYKKRHYRHHGGYYGHRHYRRNNDFAIGLGGFAVGAIIGGALAQPRYYGERRYYRTGSHADWCYARYRSYRAYDNTYQPYSGGRRQCISP